MSRRLRPGTTRVSGLTPDNARLLQQVQADGQLPFRMEVTPTTATFPCGPATAADAIRQLIDHRKGLGQETRALHAVRRKLEKQVRPGEKAQPIKPDPPKARKTKNAVACAAAGHGEQVEVGPGRAKCLDCGLILERPTPKPVKATGKATRRRSVHDSPAQRPARPGQGGVTAAQVVPAAQDAAAPQNGTTTVYVGDHDPTGLDITSPRFASIVHDGSWLVVALGDGIKPGEVLAVCDTGTKAHRIVAALHRATPRT